MDTLDKISELLFKQQKTQKDLAGHLGLNKNVFTEWKKGKSKSYERRYLYQIADFLGVSADYLLGKSDSPEAEDVNAAELLNIYNKLSAVDKAKLLVYADGLLNK